MRIIGGIFRGRQLNELTAEGVRPTSDRAREAVFNLIQNGVSGANVLDLFAGSGAMGLEALSRGANKAVFCDVSKIACEAVKSNIQKLNVKNAEVFNGDFKSVLKTLSAKGEVFDLIFIDPPYGFSLEDEALKEIASRNMLSASGIIVIERRKEDSAFSIPKGIIEYDRREYGIAAVSLLKRGTKAAVTGTFDPFTNGHLYLVEKALETFDQADVVVLVNPEKEMRFTLKKRLEFIEKAVKPFGKRVRISHYEGMTVDYCRLNGLEYIIRGVRNDFDFRYETEMAEYNWKEGGVTTLMIPAKDAEISSTAVRERAAKGGDLKGLVDKTLIKEILSEGKRWKT